MVQCVSFIDEKNTTHSLVDIVLHILFGITNVSSDEFLCRNFNKLSCRQGTDRIKDLTEDTCKSSLTRSRITSKKVVVAKQTVLHTALLTLLHILHDGFYLFLDAMQTHVFVKVGHNLLLRLGDEASGCVDVVGNYGLVGAERHLHID